MSVLNPTILRITARGLLGRRRALLLIPLPLLLIGLTVLARQTGVDVHDWGTQVLVGLGMSVVPRWMSLWFSPRCPPPRQPYGRAGWSARRRARAGSSPWPTRSGAWRRPRRSWRPPGHPPRPLHRPNRRAARC
jgi:hypothetical protein